jgi:hypothetical protein
MYRLYSLQSIQISDSEPMSVPKPPLAELIRCRGFNKMVPRLGAQDIEV